MSLMKHISDSHQSYALIVLKDIIKTYNASFRAVVGPDSSLRFLFFYNDRYLLEHNGPVDESWYEPLIQDIDNYTGKCRDFVEDLAGWIMDNSILLDVTNNILVIYEHCQGKRYTLKRIPIYHYSLGDYNGVTVDYTTI